MPFNLGPTEMLFIAVVLLVLFGAKRLPELGSGLGKGIREFKRSMKEINSDIDAPDEHQIHTGAHRPAVGKGTVQAQTAEATEPARAEARTAPTEAGQNHQG